MPVCCFIFYAQIPAMMCCYSTTSLYIYVLIEKKNLEKVDLHTGKYQKKWF